MLPWDVSVWEPRGEAEPCFAGAGAEKIQQGNQIRRIPGRALLEWLRVAAPMPVLDRGAAQTHLIYGAEAQAEPA